MHFQPIPVFCSSTSVCVGFHFQSHPLRATCPNVSVSAMGCALESLLTRLPSLHSPGARILFCWHRGVSWYVSAVMLLVGGSEGHHWQGLERKSSSCLSPSCSLQKVPPHFPVSSTSLSSLGSWILNSSSHSATASLF